jgi:hypothetical protein
MIPLPNPFDLMGSVAGKIVVDGWTAGMLAIWNGGLWLLRLVLGWVDSLLSPDLSEHGPAAELYRVTFWLAGVVLLVMVIVQIGIAAGRRDGKGLARALIGVGQFAIVWGGWIGYTVAVTAACSGLTRALMESLMNVTSWGAWQPWTPIDPKDITDAATATVLGLMGLLVWLAAIAHVIVMLTRAAALMVIVATTPIAAAGLANDTTRAWFWKAFRWFHAAALTPVVVVLVTGIGMKFAEGVANGQSTGALQAIATAVPAVVLICVASFSPLALFKLLAFVDPGTASGAAMRAGMTAVGGLQGLLRGNPAAGETAATQSEESGRSAGEADSEGATSARIANSVGTAASFLGVAGAVAATGIGAMARIGTASAAVGADVTNQAGIGHNSYYPDYSGSGGDGARDNRETLGSNEPSPADTAPPEPEPPAVAPAPSTPTPPPTSLAATSPAGGAGAGGAAAGGGSAAEAAAVAV